QPPENTDVCCIRRAFSAPRTTGIPGTDGAHRPHENRHRQSRSGNEMHHRRGGRRVGHDASVSYVVQMHYEMKRRDLRYVRRAHLSQISSASVANSKSSASVANSKSSASVANSKSSASVANSKSNDQRTTSGGEPAERPEKHGTTHSGGQGGGGAQRHQAR